MLKAIREHEPQPLGEYIACKWCGAQILDGMDATCIVRHVEVESALRPLTQPACEDYDTIGERLRQLRAEHDAMIANTPSEPPSE